MKKIFILFSVLVVFALIGISVFKFTSIFKKKDFSISKHETPNEWMAYQRCYPNQEIKQSSYLAAMKQAEAMHNSSKNRLFNWQNIGPTNIGGRITDIEVVNPTTYYIGAATGGVFKTTDNGATWQNLFLGIPIITIGDIGLDPNNQNVVYVGTGEANSSSFSFLGNGMYKSVDAGQTWQHIGLENSAYIGRVVVDHSNSNRVFVAACGNLFSHSSDRGIYRSNDAGNSWQKVLFVNDSTAAIDIVQNPQNADILYATMWERRRGLNYRRSFGDGSGIYKSINGGDTWTELTSGLPTDENVGRIGISIAPSNPNTLYAFYDNATEVCVYKTINGGTSWTRTSDNNLQGMNSTFGWYFGQIRVDPTNANRFYVLGVSLWRSDNGGSSYTLLADYYNIDEIHVDHHAITFDSNNRILEGNDGGLYTSTNNGTSWTKINNLPITQFYDIAVDRLLPYRVYGGTQDNYSIGTQSGQPDEWLDLLGGDGMYSLVDYTNSNILFAESQYGNIARSDDDGNYYEYINYQMSGDRNNWSAPYVMHPTNHNILYFGTHRIWKTQNQGDSWTAISGDLTKGPDGSGWHTISTIDISSVNPDILIVGTDDGKVQLSQNGGHTWLDKTAGLPDRWITRVKTDPFDANTIYATLSGFRWDETTPHVFKSTDLGTTWVNISGNLPELPVNCIVLDPEKQNNIYVGTDAGIFFSNNGGAYWESIMNGIPIVPVCAMVINNGSREIFAGTYGCSIYKAALTSDPYSIDLQVGENVICSEDSIRCFVSTSPAAESYIWNFGEGATPATASGTGEYFIKYSTFGTKTIHLTVTYQSQVYEYNRQVTVNQGVASGILSATDTMICAGEVATLCLSNYSGIIRWQKKSLNSSLWSNIMGTTNDTMITGSLSTNMFYRAILSTSSCGKDTSNVIKITVIQTPTIGTITASNDTICAGDVSTLYLSSYAGNIEWQFSNDNQNWNNLNFADDTITTNNLYIGTYFKSIVTDGDCGSDTSNILKIDVNTLPSVNLGKDTVICHGSTIILNPNGNFTAYTWNTDSSDSTLTLAGADMLGILKEITLTVSDANSCQNSDTIVVSSKICDAVENLDNTLNFKIFPNPAKEMVNLNISSEPKNDLRIEILDLKSNILKTKIVQKNDWKTNIQFSVTDLSSGFYILRISEGKKSKVVKLEVQK